MAHEPRQGSTGTLSVDEYLALEAATGLKHEYVLGQVYALAGASENHNRLAANVLAALLHAARASRCRVVGSDQKLQPGSDLYYYPDVQVLCDPTDADPTDATPPPATKQDKKDTKQPPPRPPNQ